MTWPDLRARLEAGRDPGGGSEERVVTLGVRPGIDIVKALRLASKLEDQAALRKGAGPRVELTDLDLLP